ncbi:acetyl-CoA C-acetyltransferase [Pseudonocardia ammonioxydans]|uniref:Acetyl-CoA C-acetyltransferase n=1 Tax=Pseudonocardia ammonioxydans TaxID=260086 RepID=A0A1I5I091_PSUAM|nr:thiolase family protein [Pseudonocardia ammonioxydans]SFO53546.1 acetyl-CoA C-acetyltransferase [Pseudonocardia ammonioxydans]
MTREAVIVDAVRTPVGKRGGQLRDWHPVDLLAHTLSDLVPRSGADPDTLADVVVGCALQRGEQAGNVARNALLGAGLPIGLPGTTLDRQCGSGQQSVHFAAQGVKSGEYDVAIGAGLESMSRTDLGPLFDPSGPRGEWYGERVLARFDGNLPAQGPSAELVVAKWGYTREQLDEFAVRSHLRAAAATEAGYFASQLVALDGADGPMTRDEGIRATPDRERMAALKPVFDPAGAITAANSSQVSDGAAALLVADRAYAESAGLPARARIVSMTVAADDPVLQFTAVLAASRAALDRAGLGIGDIDLAEVNEAFAPVPLLWRDEFGYPDDQLNVNGGSIAIGHPLGSTGGRLLTQLVCELERRDARYGLVTVCEGGGMANATVIERLT